MVNQIRDEGYLARDVSFRARDLSHMSDEGRASRPTIGGGATSLGSRETYLSRALRAPRGAVAFGTTAIASGVRGGCRSRSLQKFTGVFSNVALAKHGISGNQQIRAGTHHVANRIQRDAAIHFNPEIQPPHFALVR